MAPGQCMSHSPWHLALRNFIMQIKNKLNNLIVSTFLLLFVNKIMFTKCFFLLQKGFLFVKWVLFLSAFFKFFLPKSTTTPEYVLKTCLFILIFQFHMNLFGFVFRIM